MNEEINKPLIGYKPSLEYEDEYSSELQYIDSINSNNSDNNEAGKEEVEDLIEDLNNIGNLINKLPNNVSDLVNEVYDQVIDFVEEELKDKEVSHVPTEEEWTYIDNNDPEYDSDRKDYDNDDEEVVKDIWDDEDFFPIKKEEYTQEEIIEKEYIKNLVDLFEDYSVNLHNIMSNFWTNFFFASNNKTTSEIKMLLDNIVLSSSEIKTNAKHLLDSAVTQGIIKSMKLDYYNMMFNAEETIKRLKQLKAMQELRLRYAKIEEVDGSTKTNQMNNNVLTATKLTYDRKYEVAYENLYRYLNSSNRVLNDTLQSWIQEIKSKQILIERKGIL